MQNNWKYHPDLHNNMYNCMYLIVPICSMYGVILYTYVHKQRSCTLCWKQNTLNRYLKIKARDFKLPVRYSNFVRDSRLKISPCFTGSLGQDGHPNHPEYPPQDCHSEQAGVHHIQRPQVLVSASQGRTGNWPGMVHVSDQYCSYDQSEGVLTGCR